MDTLPLFIGIGIILFCIGSFLVITRTNAVMALMGIELMLNAANLNFISFSSTHHAPYSGNIIALFIMAIAAAEIAVALAIILHLYRKAQHIDLDQADELKH